MTYCAQAECLFADLGKTAIFLSQGEGLSDVYIIIYLPQIKNLEFK